MYFETSINRLALCLNKKPTYLLNKTLILSSLPLITNIIKDSYNLVAADATTHTPILLYT